MTNEEIDRWLRKAKRQKIQEPNTAMGQYVDECGWSKTGWAIWNKGGDCTCVPARKPIPHRGRSQKVATAHIVTGKARRRAANSVSHRSS